MSRTQQPLFFKALFGIFALGAVMLHGYWSETPPAGEFTTQTENASPRKIKAPDSTPNIHIVIAGLEGCGPCGMLYKSQGELQGKLGTRAKVDFTYNRNSVANKYSITFKAFPTILVVAEMPDGTFRILNNGEPIIGFSGVDKLVAQIKSIIRAADIDWNKLHYPEFNIAKK